MYICIFSISCVFTNRFYKYHARCSQFLVNGLIKHFQHSITLSNSKLINSPYIVVNSQILSCRADDEAIR